MFDEHRLCILAAFLYFICQDFNASIMIFDFFLLCILCQGFNVSIMIFNAM